MGEIKDKPGFEDLRVNIIRRKGKPDKIDIFQVGRIDAEEQAAFVDMWETRMSIMLGIPKELLRGGK